MEPVILKSLEGIATAEEEESLRRWRAESPENERLYSELLRIWGAIPHAYQGADSIPPPQSRDLLARAGIRSLPSHRVRPIAGKTRWIGAVGASAALIALGFGFARFLAQPGSVGGFGPDNFVTGASEAATVTLRDGTVIRLGPQSRLGVTAGQDREVTLEGRAFFAVAHAPERPFRVQTSAGKVTALGTRFELQAGGDDLNLVLLEGRVVLSTPGREVVLDRGEVTRVIAGTMLPVTRVPDAYRLMGWVGNFLAFQETSLEDAVREIEERYHVRIEITDPTLAQRAVTAWFADRTVQEVLRIVCAATLAECSNQGGVFTMR